MKPEHINGGVTVVNSKEASLIGEGATISYISDRTPTVIISFNNPNIIMLTHYETPGWYVSTANGLYSYLGPMRPYKYDYLEYKVSDVQVSKSEKWTDSSGSKVVSKNDLIVSVKVGNKYYEIRDYKINDSDNTVNKTTGDSQISLTLGEGSEEYVITRNIIDLSISDETGVLDSYDDTLHTNEATESLTAEERLMVAHGGSVSVAIVKSENNISEAGKNAIIGALPVDREIGQVVEVSVVKQITENDGTISRINITEPNKLIHVRIPISSKLIGRTGLQVYRYHKGLVDILMETPNPDGEYIEFSDDGKYIDIYSKKFSDYVITCIKAESSNQEKISNSSEIMPSKSYVKSPETGGEELTSDRLRILGFAMLFICLIIFMIWADYRKLEDISIE